MKKTLVMIVICLMSMSLFSQTYYLRDIVNHGLENSISMIRSQNTITNAKNESAISYFDLLPSATYSAAYTNPSRFDDYFSSSLSISKSFQLNEPTYFNIRQRNIDKRISNLRHEDLQKKVAMDILTEYIEIIRQIKNIEIMDENLRLQKRIYDQVKIQFDSGRKTIYELQQSQLDTLTTYIQLLELNDNLARQRENLFFMINMPDKGYPLEEFDFVIHEEVNIDLSNKNLSLQTSELSIQQSKLSLQSQYLGLFPYLSAGYSWGASYQEHSLSDKFLVPNNYYESGTFSVNLSYPLFSYLNQGIRYRISKRNFNLSLMEFDDTEAKVNQQITQLKTDLDRLKRTYGLYQQRLDLARINLQIAEERFVLGIISHFDLDRARVDYLQSEYQLTNQFYTLIKKQEDLNYLTSNTILGIW